MERRRPAMLDMVIKIPTIKRLHRSHQQPDLQGDTNIKHHHGVSI